MNKILIVLIMSLIFMNFVSSDLIPCAGDTQTVLYCDSSVSSHVISDTPSMIHYYAQEGLLMFLSLITILLVIVTFIIIKKYKLKDEKH